MNFQPKKQECLVIFLYVLSYLFNEHVYHWFSTSYFNSQEITGLPLMWPSQVYTKCCFYYFISKLIFGSRPPVYVYFSSQNRTIHKFSMYFVIFSCVKFIKNWRRHMFIWHSICIFNVYQGTVIDMWQT